MRVETAPDAQVSRKLRKKMSFRWFGINNIIKGKYMVI